MRNSIGHVGITLFVEEWKYVDLDMPDIPGIMGANSVEKFDIFVEKTKDWSKAEDITTIEDPCSLVLDCLVGADEIDR
jgi:hypothetical protein